jgi:hypothetical protein
MGRRGATESPKASPAMNRAFSASKGELRFLRDQDHEFRGAILAPRSCDAVDSIVVPHHRRHQLLLFSVGGTTPIVSCLVSLATDTRPDLSLGTVLLKSPMLEGSYVVSLKFLQLQLWMRKRHKFTFVNNTPLFFYEVQRCCDDVGAGARDCQRYHSAGDKGREQREGPKRRAPTTCHRWERTTTTTTVNQSHTNFSNNPSSAIIAPCRRVGATSRGGTPASVRSAADEQWSESISGSGRSASGNRVPAGAGESFQACIPQSPGKFVRSIVPTDDPQTTLCPLTTYHHSIAVTTRPALTTTLMTSSHFQICGQQNTSQRQFFHAARPRPRTPLP